MSVFIAYKLNFFFNQQLTISAAACMNPLL